MMKPVVCRILWVAVVIHGGPIAGQDGVGVIEEILVTAQKREQTDLEVPLSLFAINGNTLRDGGVDSLQGLGDLAAGFEVVSSSPGVVQMTVRGVTNLAVGQLDSTAAVGYYIDETPVSAYTPTELPEAALWDVDRVEVLRGPQGTLFGEASMGGTIRVITRKPDLVDAGGWISAGFESISEGGSGYHIRGSANIPLIEDELGLRINAGWRESDGWIDIPDLGLDDANGMDQSDLRLAMRWTPGDRFGIDVAYMHHEQDLDTAFVATRPYQLDPVGFAPQEAVPSAGLQPENNAYDLASVTVRYDFDTASLVSATSWFDLERKQRRDLSPFVPGLFGAPGLPNRVYDHLDLPVELLTQELRLVSRGESRLNWTAGIYLQAGDRGGSERLDFDIPLAGLVEQAIQVFDVEIDARALFGEIDYAIGERWSLAVGGRYYADDRQLTIRYPVDSLFFGVSAGDRLDFDGSDSDFAPSLSLSWSDDDRLVFGRIAKGFRAGGINDNQPLDPTRIDPAYDPEELWSYELGWKNRLAGGRVLLNAFAYFSDWSDIQLSRLSEMGLFYTDNAGRAEVVGGELELVAAPTPNWTVSMNLAVADAEITESVIDSSGQVAIASGNEIPFVPAASASVRVDRDWPLANGLTAEAHFRYAYRGSTFSEAENTATLENPASDRVHLRAGIQGRNWSIHAFVDNLLDDDESTVRYSLAPGQEMVYSTFGRPRSYGIEARWTY